MSYSMLDLDGQMADHGPSQWDFVAPTISDQHAQWHQVHGVHALCPLDCEAGEVDHSDPYYKINSVPTDQHEAVALVRCGHCQGRHTVAGVRLCANHQPITPALG